jgi:hypothetical protein
MPTRKHGAQKGHTHALRLKSLGLVGVTGAPVGRFSTADVGLNKLVTVSGLSLSGAQAGNYSLEALTLRGTIEAANLTLTELTLQGLTVVSRVYDGTREATLSGAPTLVGITSGDVVTLGGAPEASFLTAAAGTGKFAASRAGLPTRV